MKRTLNILLAALVLAFALLAVPAAVHAQTPGGTTDSPVIFGDNYNLASGQTIKDLVVFGGNASIDDGATVTGDILIFGGNLSISGRVNGDITAFGGNIVLSESANVAGTIHAIGGNRNISPGAHYGGLSSNFTSLPFRMPNVVLTPGAAFDLGPGLSILGAVFLALMLALLAVIVTLFLPHQTDRVAQTIATEPVLSGGVGLLTLVVAPAIFLVLAITIILSPLALLFLLVFGITIIFGWIALGLELGKRLAGMVHSYWPVPVSAGVGTLLLSLASNLIFVLTGSWILALCCIGLPVMVLLTILGLGAAVSSRFGTQLPISRRPAAPGSFPPPAAPPTPPVPPAPIYPPYVAAEPPAPLVEATAPEPEPPAAPLPPPPPIEPPAMDPPPPPPPYGDPGNTPA
jgi:hypothetical protein